MWVLSENNFTQYYFVVIWDFALYQYIHDLLLFNINCIFILIIDNINSYFYHFPEQFLLPCFVLWFSFIMLDLLQYTLHEVTLLGVQFCEFDRYSHLTSNYQDIECWHNHKYLQYFFVLPYNQYSYPSPTWLLMWFLFLIVFCFPEGHLNRIIQLRKLYFVYGFFHMA